MHDTTLWAGWYLLFLALPFFLLGIIIRDWLKGGHRPR